MTTRYKPTNLRALWAGCTRRAWADLPGRRTRARRARRSTERVARARRVAEPLVGEPRRPLAAFWRGRSRSCSALPELEPVDLETWYRGINRVAPGLIRVDADEVTYSLHIILRFELEQELVAGSSRSTTCRRRGTRGCTTCSASRCPTTRAASSRTCTGRAPHTATSRPTPRERALGADLARVEGSCPTWMRRSRRASSARSTSRSATGSTGTAASSRRSRRSSGRSARRDRPAAVPRLPALEGGGAPTGVEPLRSMRRAPRGGSVQRACSPPLPTRPPSPARRSHRLDEVRGPQIHVLYALPSDGVDRRLDETGALEGLRRLLPGPGWPRRRAGRTCASIPIRARSTSPSSGSPPPTPPSPPGRVRTRSGRAGTARSRVRPSRPDLRRLLRRLQHLRLWWSLLGADR